MSKKTIAILQPQFFPWIGYFEQVRLVDTFVHYDDVQMPIGRSFCSRVQIKTVRGSEWLTVPIDRRLSGSKINEVIMLRDRSWRKKHLNVIYNSYRDARFFDEAFALFEGLYFYDVDHLSLFSINIAEKVAEWLGLSCDFVKSSSLKFEGASSQRLVSICKYFGAVEYITGLGALNYIDYDLFEMSGISVRYMQYEKKPYSQLNGEFLPYVSIFDALANAGKKTTDLISSNSIYWRDYVAKYE